MFKEENKFLFEDDFINYHIKGNGPQKVVLLHGFGLSRYSWEEMLNRKPCCYSKFTFLTLDFKGSGFSSKPKNSDYSVDRQAKLVFELLEFLHYSEVSIVGHSYGGSVLLYMHYLKINQSLYNNVFISNSILLDSPAYNDFTPMFMRALTNPILSFLSLKILPSRLLSKNIIRSTFHNRKDGIKRYLDKYHFFFRMKEYDDALIQTAEQLFPDNLNEVIKTFKLITGKVLIIWGSEDKLIPISQAVRLKAEIKRSELIVLENCGHVPHEECPDEAAEAICSFLKKTN